MRLTRAQIAKPDIIRFFDEQRKTYYSATEIGHVLASQRNYWRLAQAMSTRKFCEFLTTSTPMTEFRIPFSSPYKPIARYAWRDESLLPLLLSLRQGSYLSHFTAMAIHALTLQSVHSVYVNSEQTAGSSGAPLTQRSIDAAFKRKPRTTSFRCTFLGRQVVMVSGKNTRMAGVIPLSVDDPVSGRKCDVRVTNLERTLIDAVMRPHYCGGVSEVASAFATAAESLSVNALMAMLAKIDPIYPYHQCIGYYMDLAGTYSERAIDRVRELPREFDFFLTHGLPKHELTYIEKWRLFVPRNLGG